MRPSGDSALNSKFVNFSSCELESIRYMRLHIPFMHRFSLLAALLLYDGSAQVLPCVVTSLAGALRGTSDGTGAAARLTTPHSFANASGGVFVADFNRVRFIAGSTVTTFAGGTTLGNQEGVGSNAQFRSPLYVAADPSSLFLYVADTLNFRIRAISPNGTVSALSGNGTPGSADGPPATAMFVEPSSLSLAGTVLAVADAGAHRIRSVSTLTGVAGSLAGSASNNFGWVDSEDAAAALFYEPRGVSWDLSGSLWIADTLSNRIRALLPSGRVITVAGNAARQWLDGYGTAASFYRPQGIAADPTTPRACFVFDTGNHVVRRIAPDAMVSTLAGSGSIAFASGVGAGASLGGTLHGAHTPAGLVVGSSSGTWAYLALVACPTPSASTTPSFCASASPTPSSAPLPTPSGTPTASATPPPSASGSPLASPPAPCMLSTLAGNAGLSGAADGAGTSATFNAPFAIALNGTAADGSLAWSLIIADTANHRLRGISPAGIVTTLAGGTAAGFVDGVSGTNARFNAPRGIAMDASGGAIVADSANNRVRRVAPGGGALVATICGSGAPGSQDGPAAAANITAPSGVAFDASSAIIYIAEGSRVRALSPAGIVSTVAGGLAAGFSEGLGASAIIVNPTALVAASGVVFVAASNAVRRVRADGWTTTLAGFPGAANLFAEASGPAARFSGLGGLAIDAAGNVIVADMGASRVRQVTPGGSVATIAGNGSAWAINGVAPARSSLVRPIAVAVDARGGGAVFILDGATAATVRVLTCPLGAASASPAPSPAPPPACALATVAGGGAPGWSDAAGAAALVNATAALAALNGGATLAFTDAHRVRTLAPATAAVATLAGGSACGFADGAGAVAAFCFPAGLAADATGLGLVVADRGNHRVRTVSAAGLVGTLAGSGVNGFADGPAAAAAFSAPAGAAVDASLPALVFVADTGGARIRAVSAGVVSTLAGGALPGLADGVGSNARFAAPAGLAAGSGVVYVADVGNRVIRAVAAATGSVTTLAGSASSPLGWRDGVGSAAAFSGALAHLALDAAAPTALWVADAGAHALRAIALASGAVSTPAGTGAAGFFDGSARVARLRAPTGVAFAGGLAFVVDAGNFVVRSVACGSAASPSATASPSAAPSAGAPPSPTPTGTRTPSPSTTPSPGLAGGCVVRTLAGSGAAGSQDATEGAAASFNNPAGLAVNASGAVFVADASSIRLVLPNGATTTFCGSLPAGWADGECAATARFNKVNAVALSEAQTLLAVSDQGGSVVRVINLAAQTVSTLAGNASATGFADGAAALFSAGRGLAFDAAGNIFLADSANARIRRITPSGFTTTFSGTGTQGSKDGWAPDFNFPTGFALDLITGNMWVGSQFDNTVRAVRADGLTSTLAGVAGMGIGWVDAPAGNLAALGAPVGLTYDAARAVLWCADAPNRVVRRIAAVGGATSSVGSGLAAAADGPAAVASFVGPSGVALGPNGDVFVADGPGNKIRVISQCDAPPPPPSVSSGATPSATPPPTASTTPSPTPTSTASAPQSDCVVSTLAGNAARALANGVGSAASLVAPSALALSADSATLFFADANALRAVALASADVSLLAGALGPGAADATGAAASFAAPAGLALSTDGATLFVADAGNHKVRAVAIASGATTTLAGTGAAGFANGATGATSAFNAPAAVAAEAGGASLLVADRLNFVVRRVVVATGAATVLAGNGTSAAVDGAGSIAQFLLPRGLALDAAAGVAFVLDGAPAVACVRAIAVASSAVTTLAGSGMGVYFDNPAAGLAASFLSAQGIALAPSGGGLVVADGNVRAMRAGAPARAARARAFTTAPPSPTTHPHPRTGHSHRRARERGRGHRDTRRQRRARRRQRARALCRALQREPRRRVRRGRRRVRR